MCVYTEVNMKVEVVCFIFNTCCTNRVVRFTPSLRRNQGASLLSVTSGAQYSQVHSFIIIRWLEFDLLFRQVLEPSLGTQVAQRLSICLWLRS